jgi:hypothetical protein
MTQAADDTGAVTQLRARNALIRTVRESLKGRGLDIRERTRELVISHPGDPERGRIYITLASGEVSYARTTWTYLGHLLGHSPSRDPDDDLTVDADLITATLTQPATPTCPHTGGGLH